MGLVERTSNGNRIINPLVGAANRAMQLMLKAAAEFGMTPAARSRVDVDALTIPSGPPSQAKPKAKARANGRKADPFDDLDNDDPSAFFD